MVTHKLHSVNPVLGDIGRPPTGCAGRRKLSCEVPASVVLVRPTQYEHDQWVLTVCTTVRPKQGKIYLEEEMWSKHALSCLWDVMHIYIKKTCS